MRIAFFGTPAFAVPTLEAIRDSSHALVGVVTQPDRPRGRGHRVQPSAVKAAALACGAPILQPDSVRAEPFLDAFDAWRADLAVVAAYGQLLPQSLLDRPALGMINVHASLLPRWRGAAPIHRAILAGDQETGVTIMRVVLALDAGPMLAHDAVSIGAEETAVELEARLAARGGRLAAQVIDQIATGAVHEEPQDDARVTYAKRLDRSESPVDWSASARSIHNRVRGLQPWPLATTSVDGLRVRLLGSRLPATAALGEAAAPGTIVELGADGVTVATGAGRLVLTRLQPDGRPVLAARDFINGYRIAVGSRLTSPSAP